MRQAIGIAIMKVPCIPLCQLLLDVAMQANVTGYQFWFHLPNRANTDTGGELRNKGLQ
jgi:hypothetical protein